MRTGLAFHFDCEYRARMQTYEGFLTVAVRSGHAMIAADTAASYTGRSRRRQLHAHPSLPYGSTARVCEQREVSHVAVGRRY
jgi:hypothetical protein